MTVKFGDKVEVTASPKLVIEFEEKISEWLAGVIDQGEVTDRDTIAIAQGLISHLFEEALEGLGNESMQN